MSKIWEWITGGVGVLLGGLREMASNLVGKVLATFGLSVVTFESILPVLKDYLTGFISGLPVEIVDFLGAIGIGMAMSMILSALTVRMAWKTFIVPTSVANAIPGAGQ